MPRFHCVPLDAVPVKPVVEFQSFAELGLGLWIRFRRCDRFESLRAEFDDFLSGRNIDNESPWALSLAIFQQVQKQRGGYITLTHIQKYLYSYLLDHLNQPIPKRKRSIPSELLAHYIGSSFIALMTWWIDNNYPYPPEKMNEFFRQLVEPGTLAIMH